jgi:hypothetical protein
MTMPVYRATAVVGGADAQGQTRITNNGESILLHTTPSFGVVRGQVRWSHQQPYNTWIIEKDVNIWAAKLALEYL